ATLVAKELPKLEQSGVKFYLPPPGGIRVNNQLSANSSLPGIGIEYSLNNGKDWVPYQDKVDVGTEQVLLRSRLHSVVSNIATVD
ncbi:MAG TPA: chitobiase/beta-hexosaminidase C-terminal domain-containing protein, partial [Cellvibrio sp.]